MGVPHAIQEKALEAERLIKIEQTFLMRFNKYFVDALEEIKPILDDIKESKKGENLSFGTALACLKQGHEMTNDRLIQEDRNKAIYYRVISPIKSEFCLVTYNNKGVEYAFKSWLPAKQDLSTDDWRFFYPPEEGEE